jgi:hypothetical protein
MIISAWQLALEQARALGRQPQQRPNYNEVPPYVYEIIENSKFNKNLYCELYTEN